MNMFASLALAALLASTTIFVRGQVTPLAPAPGDIFKEGSTCHIAWSVDKTGLWKTTNIELMTGNNIDMVHLTTVATVDGTIVSAHDYRCPVVTVHSAIYFYQFSSPNSTDLFWTGRFAITDASGNTVPPSESTQPDGSPIPWGTGALKDPSTATPAPPYLSGNTTVTASIPISSSSSVAARSSSTVNVITSVVQIPSASLAPPSSSASSAASGAVSDLVVNGAVWPAVGALGAAACAFTFLF